MGFANKKTGERKYIYNPPEQVISAPADKPNRGCLVKGEKFIIAYDNFRYDGLSITYNNGGSWEHVENASSLNNTTCRIIYHNGVFYLDFAGINNGYYTSTDGKNWETHRPEIKDVSAITSTDKGLLLIYTNISDSLSFNKPNTFIENLDTSIQGTDKNRVIQKIANFKSVDVTYCSQINSVVLTGFSLIDNVSHGALYLIQTEGILTGSGITNFETTDKTLVAQFGNGLQIAAYKPNAAPPSFVGTSYTFPSNTGDRLTIGRWF